VINKKIEKNKVIIILLSVLVISQLSFGASFECKKSNTEVEKAVCSDKTLSRLDEFLALTYQKALKRSSHKNRLKSSQRDWLRSKRDPCGADDICLKDEYFLRILKLTKSRKNASLSGRYERYVQNKPDLNTSDIDILELDHREIYISGTALWSLSEENSKKGIVHIGEINGIFPLRENRVRYHDDYGSTLLLIFEKNSLIVSESKDESNWGANVTFDGQYKKRAF